MKKYDCDVLVCGGGFGGISAALAVARLGKRVTLLEKPLPEGWALDKDGHPSTNAPDVLANIVAKKGGGIMPLGGSTEQLGSHKGYGYGILCEIFSSILSMGATSNYCMTDGKGKICHGFLRRSGCD